MATKKKKEKVEAEIVEVKDSNPLAVLSDLENILPSYTEDTAEIEVQEPIHCSFVKEENNKFDISGVGVVGLSEVTFRILSIEECYTAYDNATKKYYQTDKLNGDETHAAVVILEYKGEYYVRTLRTRRSRAKITAAMFNFNLKTAEKIKKDSPYKSKPYLVARTKVTLKLASAKNGHSYLVLDELEPQEIDNEELQSFFQFLQEEETAADILDCLNRNRLYINGGEGDE